MAADAVIVDTALQALARLVMVPDFKLKGAHHSVGLLQVPAIARRVILPQEVILCCGTGIHQVAHDGITALCVHVGERRLLRVRHQGLLTGEELIAALLQPLWAASDILHNELQRVWRPTVHTGDDLGCLYHRGIAEAVAAGATGACSTGDYVGYVIEADVTGLHGLADFCLLFAVQFLLNDQNSCI